MKLKEVGFVIGILLTIFFYSAISEAVPTKLIVRAKSVDAKFIGSKMGGATVIIKDSKNGKVLSKGTIEGVTGSTKRIIVTPLQRGALLSGASTAKFETTVDINEPILATIEVQGPLGWKQSIVKSSTQIWLIPGKDILGDGIVLLFYGFAVDLITPEVNKSFKFSGNNISVPVTARIVMI